MKVGTGVIESAKEVGLGMVMGGLLHFPRPGQNEAGSHLGTSEGFMLTVPREACLVCPSLPQQLFHRDLHPDTLVHLEFFWGKATESAVKVRSAVSGRGVGVLISDGI